MENSVNIKTFLGRKSLGDRGEDRVIQYLENKDFDVERISLSDRMRKAISKYHDDTAYFMRYRADIFALRQRPYFPLAYWEVKSQSDAYKNFSIEKEHWDTNKKLMDSGIRVIYAFNHFNGSIHAHWMKAIEPKLRYHPGGKNGSRKEMYLVPCEFVPTIDTFILNPPIVCFACGRIYNGTSTHAQLEGWLINPNIIFCKNCRTKK